MGRSATTALRVRWGETDAMGIAFYPNVFAWFDLGAHELLRAPDRSVASLMERGYSVPIVETGARFIAPAYYDDELVVTSTVTEMSSRTFRIEHAIDRAGQPVARGFEVRVVARSRPGEGGLETVPIPDDLHAWLASES